MRGRIAKEAVPSIGKNLSSRFSTETEVKISVREMCPYQPLLFLMRATYFPKAATPSRNTKAKRLTGPTDISLTKEEKRRKEVNLPEGTKNNSPWGSKRRVGKDHQRLTAISTI